MACNIAPINKELTIQRGMTKAYEVQIIKDGTAEDITGWTITFIVKNKLGDADASAVIEKIVTDHSDPLNGKSLIRLEATDTDITAKSYYYSLKFTDVEDPVNKGVIIWGRINIEKIA